MRLICVLCSSEYNFEPDRVPDQGFRLGCPKCGTRYSVTLPEGWRQYGEPAEETVPEPVGPPAGDGRFILLADDTEFFRAMMSDLLISKGFTVKIAEDGQEALDLFLANPDAFQLIILDLQMPRLSGFGVLESLTKEEVAVPPIIVMTGVHDSHEDIKIVREMGAAGFIDKSLDPAVAFERIEMVLNQEKPS